MTKLHDGLSKQWDGQMLSDLGTTLLDCVVLMTKMDNNRTAFEFGRAVEGLVDAVSKEPPSLIYTDESKDREGVVDDDDPRPLYQRIDDEAKEIGQSIRIHMAKLQFMATFIADAETRALFIEAINDFWKALGIPTKAEIAANPDAHPKVGEGLSAVKILADLAEKHRNGECSCGHDDQADDQATADAYKLPFAG